MKNKVLFINEGQFFEDLYDFVNEMLENDKSNDKYILSKQIPSTWGLSKANKYLLQGKDH